MKKLLASLFTIAALYMAAPAHAQTAGRLEPEAQQPQQNPQQNTPSIVGKWQGKLHVAGVVVDVTATFRPNGTYSSMLDNSGYIVAEKGKYTMNEEHMDVEPEGGFSYQAKITWKNANEFTFKANGMTIVMKRQ